MPNLLSLTAAQTDDETLQNLTRELARALSREATVSAEPVPQAAPANHEGNTKGGEWLTQAAPIAIAAVSKGGPVAAIAVAIVSVLKVYVNRVPELKFIWQPKSGKKFEITAKDLDDAKLDRVIALIEKAMQEDE